MKKATAIIRALLLAAKDGKTCSTGAWVILDPTSGRVYDLTTMDNGAYKITTGDYCN